MGGGKGSVEYWAGNVRKGKRRYEVSGVEEKTNRNEVETRNKSERSKSKMEMEKEKRKGRKEGGYEVYGEYRKKKEEKRKEK